MGKSMRNVVILGGSGYIGKSVGFFLFQKGFNIRVITRYPGKTRNELPFPAKVYDLESSNDLDRALDNCHVVINLAGKSVFEGMWWTKSTQLKLLHSRVEPTIKLIQKIKSAKIKPKLYLQASGISYYGDQSSLVDESSRSGKGFLAHLAESWEASVASLESIGLRVAILRIGAVIGNTSQASRLMDSVYSQNLGSKLGDGRQWLSWIYIDDLLRTTYWILTSENISGIFNCVSPNPIQNRFLHKSLKKVYGHQLNLPIPAKLFKLLLGKKSEIALNSTGASPTRLTSNGFYFKNSEIGHTLNQIFSWKKSRANGADIFQDYLDLTSSRVLEKISSIGFYSTSKHFLSFKSMDTTNLVQSLEEAILVATLNKTGEAITSSFLGKVIENKALHKLDREGILITTTIEYKPINIPVVKQLSFLYLKIKTLKMAHSKQAKIRALCIRT